jgi:phosphoesterase RecJ-like protein
LTGALLDGMELYWQDRLAVLYFDEDLLRACGATVDDTEGLVNVPLAAKDVVAAALFKRQPDGALRLSLRSKPGIDVRLVAQQWNGGGHTNAAGCTIVDTLPNAKAAVVEAIGRQMTIPAAGAEGLSSEAAAPVAATKSAR